MTQLMTKLGRATRTGAFTAMLVIIGVTAVMASAKAAQAADLQASEAADDDVTNRQAVGPGYAAAPARGPYANARHDRRSEASPAPRKDFQDIK